EAAQEDLKRLPPIQRTHGSDLNGLSGRWVAPVVIVQGRFQASSSSKSTGNPFLTLGDETMLQTTRGLLAIATILISSAIVAAADKDEMVDNPLYKHWANCKPG